MNDAEKARLQDAVASITNMEAEISNFLGNNAKFAPGDLQKMAKLGDADTQKKFKDVILPAYEKAKKAAEAAKADLAKLWSETRDAKAIASSADAKAFRNAHAKRGESIKAFYEAGKAYVLTLVIGDADVKKLREFYDGKSPKNPMKDILFRGMSEVPIKVTVGSVEMYGTHFETFRKKWNDLDKPAATGPAPARPSAPPPVKK